MRTLLLGRPSDFLQPNPRRIAPYRGRAVSAPSPSTGWP